VPNEASGVPLYDENRIPELQLTNDNLTEDVADIRLLTSWRIF